MHYSPRMGELVRRAVLAGELAVGKLSVSTLPLEPEGVRDAA